MKNFADLTEREVLAVAISSEEEDSRIYMSFAEDLPRALPGHGKFLRGDGRGGTRPSAPPAADFMKQRFLVRTSAADPPRGRQRFSAPASDLAHQEPAARHDPQGSRDHGARGRAFLRPAPPSRPRMSACAACSATSPKKRSITRTARPQLTDRDFEARRARRRRPHPAADVRAAICAAGPRRVDGRLGSTFAPLFAAAFATHQNWQTFLVGLAASIGAGISMGFAEALSDDGSLTGRGSPWLRGTPAER